jgi:hypothetical protein
MTARDFARNPLGSGPRRHETRHVARFAEVGLLVLYAVRIATPLEGDPVAFDDCWPGKNLLEIELVKLVVHAQAALRKRFDLTRRPVDRQSVLAMLVMAV